MDEDLDAVISGELALLQPDIRRDADAVRSYLHPDFREFGASGTVWDRKSVVRATAADASDDGIRAEDLRPARLGLDAVLLTYTARTSQGSSLRTSVWVRTRDGWRMLHHQGTRCPRSPAVVSLSTGPNAGA